MLDKRLLEAARQQVRDAGDRVTPARVQVLGVLLAARRALSHHDIEQALAQADRVTLYRVLDWLVDKGLAHRIAGADRVWRFSIASDMHHDHAHFQCSACGKMVCLNELRKPAVQLPRGYRSERMELTVQGRCAECA